MVSALAQVAQAQELGRGHCWNRVSATAALHVPEALGLYAEAARVALHPRVDAAVELLLVAVSSALGHVGG